MPVVSPLNELRHPSYPVKMIYLFLAGGVLPMIPGGFLTFSDEPLYRLYELAPRVDGFSALSDQQLAGAIMKVGNVPIIWPVIWVMFSRWFRTERKGARPEPFPAEARGAGGWLVTAPDDGDPTHAHGTTAGTSLAPQPGRAPLIPPASAATPTSTPPERTSG
jgi:hypothetical protein